MEDGILTEYSSSRLSRGLLLLVFFLNLFGLLMPDDLSYVLTNARGRALVFCLAFHSQPAVRRPSKEHGLQ